MADTTFADLVADAGTVCDLARTTLGPFGATKLVIRRGGNVTTTASGAELLDDLEVTDPGVTLLRTGATGFRDRHGDGATTLVTFAGALLEEAVGLVDQGLHPTAVERGYREGLSVALDRLDGRSHPLSLVGPAAVARTALTATRNPAVKRRVGEYVAEVAEAVGDAGPAGPTSVKVSARIGAASETELVQGLVLDHEPVSEAMPRREPDAGVALLSSTVDLPRLGGATGGPNARVVLSADSFDDRAAIGESEREAFRDRLRAAVDAGCRFVATERAVNDRVKSVLADHGVVALERVERDDLGRLARSTGARVVPSLGHASPETLGRADVTVRREAGRDFVFVESAAGDPVYTLFCRAPDPRSVSEFEASVESAIAATVRAAEDGTVVPGGGAIDVELARAVREHARSVDGREQLAVEAFADALEVVPRTLATNAGLDGWTGLIRLRVAHHEGRSTIGIDALAGETGETLRDDPIVEPAGLKRDALSAATDLAAQLIRIDERLPATDLGPREPGPPEDGQPVSET
ncbi:TCP-1/cpn60 chaperonin family protein [Halegenticoccus soli]|uniref:TCP-1/cpn60 chaperonin family protein n=1 Tax=Halegenticoccus soli TaxID=1985678 RepID=UPI000C6D444B|nr:TCP-1/cpn60 chaperonin family protein [Halegenticoccus soli]